MLNSYMILKLTQSSCPTGTATIFETFAAGKIRWLESRFRVAGLVRCRSHGWSDCPMACQASRRRGAVDRQPWPGPGIWPDGAHAAHCASRRRSDSVLGSNTDFE